MKELNLDSNFGKDNEEDNNIGFFITDAEEYVVVFNKPCPRRLWDNCEKPSFLYFKTRVRITTDKMTAAEKAEHPDYKLTGGYHKTLSHDEAWEMSYAMQDDKEEELRLLFDLPNFDASIFKEISGLDFTDEYLESEYVKSINEVVEAHK